MKRWVGSSIDFNEPQVNKIAVKPSKKLHRQANAVRKISVPDLIVSQYNPSVDGNFKLELDYRFKNQDEKFIYMDGKRKVGRQKIPTEFL